MFKSVSKRPRGGKVRLILAVSASMVLMMAGCGDSGTNSGDDPCAGLVSSSPGSWCCNRNPNFPGCTPTGGDPCAGLTVAQPGTPCCNANPAFPGCFTGPPPDAVLITPAPVPPPPNPDPGPAPGVTPVAHHGQLRVEGSYIVNQHGRAVQLRGMSLFWSHSRNSRHFYNAEVVRHIATDWQATVVRAAMAVNMNWSGDEQGFLTGDPSNRQRVLDVVAAARQHGIYVIIDWHSYQAEFHQNEAVQFFSEMASMFAGVPNVIYEIYNEPICARPQDAVQNPNRTCTPGVSEAQYWTQIKPYMQAVTNAIRAHDPHNLIILGTPLWCQRPDVAAADPITGNNLVYSLHFYANSIDHRSRLRENAYRAMQSGKPIFVSEFGSVSADGAGAHNAAETDIWMDFMDQFCIGWANWALHASPQTSAALTTGSQPTQPSTWTLSPSGTYIRNRLRTPRKTTPTFFTVAVRRAGDGEVAITPRPADKQLFMAGESVTLTAGAASGATFVGWSGSYTGTERIVTVPITNANIDVTGTFRR